MNINTKIMSMAIAATLVGSSLGGLAYAGNQSEEAKEIKLFNQTKISITDAIKTAEKAVGGEAMDASLDDESKTVQFEVEILKDNQVQKVMVDGKTGVITKVSNDDEDKGHDEGKEEKDD